MEADAERPTVVTLTWSTVPGATGYEVFRSGPAPAAHKHHFALTPDRSHKVCWCGARRKLRRAKRQGARR